MTDIIKPITFDDNIPEKINEVISFINTYGYLLVQKKAESDQMKKSIMDYLETPEGKQRLLELRKLDD